MNFNVHCNVKIIAAVAVCAVLFLGACALKPSLAVHKLGIRTSAGTIVTLKAEIARTEAEQERGYMERKTIPDGTGMMFVFPSDRQMHFWMDNTPHPLSIAYIDSTGVIREIYDMVPYSKATVSSISSLRYALEVPAGWFTRVGIRTGDVLDQATFDAILASPKARR